MFFGRIKNLDPLHITIILFILFIIPLFIIEIFLISLIGNDFATAAKYTFNFFFGIESPFVITTGSINIILNFFIIVLGYLLVSINWIGVPILIVQYFFVKRKKESEIREKLEMIMIYAEIKKRGGFKKLNPQQFLDSIEEGKKLASVANEIYRKKKKS